jgi:hypothetical protein
MSTTAGCFFGTGWEVDLPGTSDDLPESCELGAGAPPSADAATWRTQAPIVAFFTGCKGRGDVLVGVPGTQFDAPLQVPFYNAISSVWVKDGATITMGSFLREPEDAAGVANLAGVIKGNSKQGSGSVGMQIMDLAPTGGAVFDGGRLVNLLGNDEFTIDGFNFDDAATEISFQPPSL